ncbi:CARDB domain-containing protein [Planctomycetota bacterium]
MLDVEILEPRCLLSAIITDSYGDPEDLFVEFPTIDRGTAYFPGDYVTIFNDSNTDSIIINDLSINRSSFKMIPPDNTPITILPLDEVQIELVFTPWNLGELTGPFTIDLGVETHQVDLLGHSVRGDTDLNLNLLGDLTITDLTITSSDGDPLLITSGESLEISVTVENTGTVDFVSGADLHLTASKDPEGLFSKLVINNTTLFIDPLNVGESQTITLNVPAADIPNFIEDVGYYHIIANVDPRWQVPEYEEKSSPNTNNDIDNFLASSELYFDIAYTFTDSSVPPGDSLIDFHNTGVGRVSSPEYITVTNVKNEPIEITNIDTPANNFSWEMPPRVNSTGVQWNFNHDDAEEIFPGQVVNGAIASGIDAYYFEADQGSYVEVNVATNTSEFISGYVRVFSSHGDPILNATDLGSATIRNNPFITLEFPAFYTGAYYLELSGTAIAGQADYQLLVTAGENPNLELKLTRKGDTYSNTFIGGDLPEQKVLRLWFDADYGDDVQIDLKTTYDVDSGLVPASIAPRLYNEHGTLITLYSIPDNGELNIPGIILDKYEFNSFNEGANYLYLQYFLGPGEKIDFECHIEQTDDRLTIDPGKKVVLPVWFTPQQTGDLEGELSLMIDIGVTDPDTGLSDPQVTVFSLTGEGLTGDFYIANVKPLDLEFSNKVQAGTSLHISATAVNDGPGDMDQVPMAQFILSLNNKIGDEDDIFLATVGLTELLWRERVTFDTWVNIPQNIQETFYLFALVDPDQLIPEHPISNPEDPGGQGNRGNYHSHWPLHISSNSLISIDSVYDTEEEKFDSNMDFGPTQLGSNNIEVLSLQNRSQQPVNVTGMELSTNAFKPYGWEDPQSAFEPFVILPGNIENMPIVFAPSAFPSDGASDVESELIISTDENLDPYKIILTGTLQGPDLVVMSGEQGTGMAKVIEELDFEMVSVEDTSEVIMITLRNLGNESLTVSAVDFTNEEHSAFHFVEHQIELSDQTIMDIPIPRAPFHLSAYGSTDDKGEKIYEKTVALAFTPYSPSQFIDTLIIRSDVVADDYKVRLSGQGKAPLLKVYDYDMNGNPMGEASDDKFLPFGWHEVGKSAQATIRMVNEGNNELEIQGWYLANENQDDFTINIQNDPDDRNDDILRVPGASFDLIITFEAPGDGLYSDTLIIHSNDGDRAIELSSLSGQASYPSLAIVSASKPVSSGATLDLGTVLSGQAETRWLRIKNTGLVGMELENVDFIVNGEGFSYDLSSTAQHELNEQGHLDLESAGDSFLLSVRFDASGDYDQTNFDGFFKVRYLPESFPDRYYTVNLTASIITPGIIIQEPDFPALYPGERASGTAIITNDGTADLVIRQWYTDNPLFEVQAPSEKLNEYGQLVIAPDQSVSLTIFSQPERLIDDDGRLIPFANGNLTLTTNVLDDNQEYTNANVALFATVLPEEIEVLPGSPISFLDYDNQLVTVSITHGEASFTLANGAQGGHYIDELQLLESSEKTKLNISVRGGETFVGTITSSDSLATIKAPKVIINEDININGSLTQLLLGDISNGVEINVALAPEKPMTVKAGYINDDVSLYFAGDLKIFQAHSFLGGTLEAADINKLKITKGDLGAQVTAQQINRIKVHRDISGGIFAYDTINTVVTKKGTLSAELRGNSINSVQAYALNQAVISAWHIGKVRISTDVVDSYLLAGFDIGMKGLQDPTDDYLYQGRLDFFRFGGELRNTFVAAGVMPDRIYESLSLPRAAGSETSAGAGAIGNIKGKTVRTDPGLAEFGFYAAESINTNLIPLPPNFVIIEDL